VYFSVYRVGGKKATVAFAKIGGNISPYFRGANLNKPLFSRRRMEYNTLHIMKLSKWGIMG
jgi:hypothetical protein